jgi:hypothetical protein
MPTPADNLIASYRHLANGLRDIVHSERLLEADLPDDFTWLEKKLAELSALEVLFTSLDSNLSFCSIDAQERNTILAALRVYQRSGYGEPAKQPDWVFDLASNGETEITLNDEAIDALCEKVNLS